MIPCLSAGLAVAVSAGPAVAAYQASVYDNKTAFTTCAGINTTIPQQLRALAVDGFRYMQYAPSSFEATTSRRRRCCLAWPTTRGSTSDRPKGQIRA